MANKSDEEDRVTLEQSAHGDQDQDQDQDQEELQDSVSELKNSSLRERPVAEEMSGSLLRLKNKPSTFSSWDSRFVRINSGREELEFFSSEKDQYLEPLQSLSLAHICRAQSVDKYSLQIIVKGKPETVIFLRAPSPEDKMRWVHNLELFLRELRSYESWLVLSRMKQESRVELPAHEGWLYKLRRTPSTFGPSWDKRFFRFNPEDQSLDYFNSTPSKGVEPKKKRTIKLTKVVDVRTIDPWTFQIEVKEDSASEKESGPNLELGEGEEGSGGTRSPRRLAKQDSTQAGNMNYFCLQAKTQADQAEWKSILENYLMDLAVVKECEFLGDHKPPKS